MIEAVKYGGSGFVLAGWWLVGFGYVPWGLGAGLAGASLWLVAGISMREPSIYWLMAALGAGQVYGLARALGAG